MSVSLALQSDKSYVDTQVALTANQLTYCTNSRSNTELAKKVNTTDMNVALALKANTTHVGNQLATQSNQSATYTKNRSNTNCTESQSINYLYKS
jgi:hypothetical protein